MDNFADPALKLKYNKSKLKVKLWESEFKKKTGDNPSKDDIKEAPCEIREAYKWYWQIKIHALGQDSMLDATFVEPKLSELSSTAISPEEKSNTTTNNTEHQGFPSDDLIPNELNIVEKILFEKPPVEVETVFQKNEAAPHEVEKMDVNPSKPISTSVWGSHLNKHKSLDSSPRKKNLNRSSSSFQLSEKLFVGAKFKKRNPRKSLSFTVGRGKEKNSLVSSDSLIAPSDSSISLDNSQGVDDGFPVSDLEGNSNLDIDLKLNNPDFKLIKGHATSSMQPVSAVQKLMEGNLNASKPRIERSIDKGWLDRVMQVDEILSQETKKNSALKPSNSDNCESNGGSSNAAVLSDSDDDIIYGSDNESKSPRKVEKEEKARLALRPTVPNEPFHSAALINSTCNSVNVIPPSEKSEVNGKKRKLDAIEAAMAVLSERRKSDRNLSQPSKKLKKAESLLEEDNIGSEADENVKASNSSVSNNATKPKMSKKEVLEKKVASGTVNDNFVRINMKKKVFVRGKKTMNFQKYKKQQWKNKKKELSDQTSAYLSRMDPSDSLAGGGLQKCFQCGDVGHFARQCTKMKGDSLMPLGEGMDEEESPFPSLADVEKMAREKSGSVHFRSRSSAQVDSAVLGAVSAVHDVTKGETPNEDLLSCNDDTDITSIMNEPVRDSERKFVPVGPLYTLKKDGSVIDTPSEVYDCLHQFGHQHFRPGQEAAVMRILSGLPTLVTLSTGSGKSLCYQLPAYLYATKRKCITLIVSPLVSLMDDQISGLPSFINGAALHTGQTEKQREKVMDMAKSGKLHFLLVSPEAVVAGERKSGFGSLLRELPNIAFACIDEAHCVSQWSHNFRPSYLVIFKVLREKLGVQTVLGLTATATQTAVTSIIEHMRIPDGRLGVIQDTPLPNNLLLSVSRDSIRDQALIALLSSTEFQNYQSIIVYCTRREECERLAALLRTCLKERNAVTTGKPSKVSNVSEAYHAGLSSARRKQVQTAFMSGALRIVVATVAFGMGINKADIRSVIHFNMPCNFESYVQEVGRAGRDGQASRCHLFLNSEGKDLNELRRHIFSDSVDRHAIRKLLQRVFVPCKCDKDPDGQSQVSECTNEILSESSNEKPKESTEETPRDSTNQNLKAVQQSGSDSAEDFSTKSKNRGTCVGHEVAFSVEETVAALDLPEENITTLLCYLELHDKKLLQVLPKAYTHCKVQSYKGMKHIRDVAKSCPPLAMAIAMDLMSGNSHTSSPTIEFPVVEIASAIGWDSGVVKRELMNLEWTKVNGSSKRSGIKVEFSNLGFRVKAPGNLSPETLDKSLDFLHERVNKQEKSALCQLQTIFRAVTSVSFSSISATMQATENEVETRSDKLKSVVRAYFQEEQIILENLKVEEKLDHGDQIANDIRQLVNMYRDCTFTGRAVARIFHGIGSPNFSPMVWGRCRFWRAHLESDFKLLCLLATRVLIQMR